MMSAEMHSARLGMKRAGRPSTAQDIRTDLKLRMASVHSLMTWVHVLSLTTS